MIVSPLPGTTRDAVDSTCSYHGKKYILIDTAGLRKKARIGYSIERYSMVRAVRSIERCDIALILLDTAEGISEQDQKIAGIVKEYGKSAIFLFNKWDLVETPDESYDKLIKELNRKMWFSNYAPVITVSGLAGKRITKIFPVVDRLMAERRKRIQTSELNKFFREIVLNLPLPPYKGKPVKMYYMAQVEGEPPAFVIFVNYPGTIKDFHLKFIEKEMRNRFGFEGTPIKFFIKRRKREARP